MRDTGRCAESVVAMKSQLVLWKSFVARLLCKFTGRYGEVTAVVERQRSLGEVSGCCGKSLIVTYSHWELKNTMVAMGSHC
jgi:hypothetical protein